MKFNVFADMGLVKEQTFPTHGDMIITPGGFNPRRYYDKSQMDAILAGFVPSGGGGSAGSGYELTNGPQDDGAYVYVGLLKSTGAWYIYRREEATDIRLYASGSSGYTTAWTNRGSLTYV